MRKITAVAALSFAGGFFSHWLVSLALLTPPPPPPSVGSAEVSDLVRRLLPFVQDEKSEYSGVAVTYSGGGVSIRLRLKNRNEYNAKSGTLSGAVMMLTAPSDEIKQALSGWKSP